MDIDFKNNPAPLAEKVRPQSLDEFFGQDELTGTDSFLRRAIESDKIPSMILWGPPGTGKTTLARIIARRTKSEFSTISATTDGVKELRRVIEQAQSQKRLGRKTVLFIDEIHRWNKAQQDALLPFIEQGIITLIGATTENPSFEVNSALLSRTRVFILKTLNQKSILKIIERALEIINQKMRVNTKIGNNELKLIASQSNGDARAALNILELLLGQNKKITIPLIKRVIQKQHLLYDKDGEEHYNLISALHKSIRGGDADASLYWLARMLKSGEDPVYIARRLIRFASEDVGLANNSAILLANAAFDACRKIGMPECAVNLAHAVIYLAKSKKNVVAYEAYSKAEKDVDEHGSLPVPLHLRNAPTKLMKDIGYGRNYKYTPKENSSNQTYFPEKIKGRKYIQNSK